MPPWLAWDFTSGYVLRAVQHAQALKPSGTRSMAEKEEPQSLWSVTARYSGLGLQWALSVLLFTAVGWWLDGRLGVAPLFTILGAFVGGGAGFYSFYVHLVVEPRERGEEGSE